MMQGSAKYCPIRIAGRGAFGEIWMAEDVILGRTVALKYLNVGPGIAAAEKEEMIARFLREAQVAGRLNHPNVVTVYDYGETEGRPFIAMEFVNGETLDKVISRGPMPLATAASIISQVCRAMQYAHSQGVVHRDLKPANIFLCPDGQVKVADFGIAHLVESGTLTSAGTIMGTPGYMSPEQIAGMQVDARSDIFSCGVVFFELLTGVQPFGADSLTAVMYRVVNQPLPSLRQMRPDLPEWVTMAIETACAKDPSSRFESAGDFLDFIRQGMAASPSQQTVAVQWHASEGDADSTMRQDPSTVLCPDPPTVLRGDIGPMDLYMAEETHMLDALPHPGFAPAQKKRNTKMLLALIIPLAVVLAGGAAAAIILTIRSGAKGGSAVSNNAAGQVTVPDVKGMTWEQARSRLEEKGLRAEKKEKETDSTPENTVISQSPSAGQLLDRGSTVSLEVARRKKETLEDVQTIGGSTGPLYINDIRYGDHSDVGEYWVVFEIYNYDGSICQAVPYVKAGWDAPAGGIKVMIGGIKEAGDGPFPGQTEAIEGRNRDLAGVVRSIEGLPQEGGNYCYLIHLTGKRSFSLEYTFTTGYRPDPTVKIVIKVKR